MVLTTLSINGVEIGRHNPVNGVPNSVTMLNNACPLKTLYYSQMTQFYNENMDLNVSLSATSDEMCKATKCQCQKD